METVRAGPSGEKLDTPRHRALGSSSRVAILSLVRAASPGTPATDSGRATVYASSTTVDAGPAAVAAGLTTAEVADRTGLHPSTVRAHLDRLLAAGLLVKTRASNGAPGRPAWRYRTAAPAPAPAPYRALAAALLAHLAADGDGMAAARQAGQAWGRQLASTTARDDPAEAVMAVLRELGFDPRPQPAPVGPGHPATGVTVHLHSCPFLELVGRTPGVMCALHAGVIHGVLRAADPPRATAVLEPFAAPDACVVEVRPAGVATEAVVEVRPAGVATEAEP